MPSLSTLNYAGTFVTKNEIREGLATFFDQERFEKLEFKSSVISQNIDFPKFSTVWSKIENEKVKERFLSRNTTIQVISFVSHVDTTRSASQIKKILILK